MWWQSGSAGTSWRDGRFPLKVRFASFHTVTRSLSLEEGTDLQEEIYRCAGTQKTDLHE
ncbi:MAG: hypothetical protein ACLVHE_07335 [Dialister invisus]